MSKLEEKKEELRKLEEYHKSVWEDYGSELCAGGMLAEEKKLEEEIIEIEELEDQAVWNMYAEAHEIKSGMAYKHLFENHTHPLGDEGEDMVTFGVALEAIKIAEKELNPFKIGDMVELLCDIKDGYSEICHNKGDIIKIKKIADDGVGLMFRHKLGTHFSNVKKYEDRKD
jgi:hypothetical protein